jgi:hypothetical protein
MRATAASILRAAGDSGNVWRATTEKGHVHDRRICG